MAYQTARPDCTKVNIGIVEENSVLRLRREYLKSLLKNPGADYRGQICMDGKELRTIDPDFCS